jgi:integrative and conjugative element protein (TIGR02256 family)
MRRAVTLRLNVTPEVEATIRRLARLSEDGRETGGILLGKGPSEHGLIDIIQAGDPGPEAVRQPDSFLRDLNHARELADAAWPRSRAAWIGEWHTHPGAGPAPSARDLVTYADLLANPGLGFDVFVAIIVTPGRERDWNEPTLTPWLIGQTECPGTVLLTRL